MKSHSYRSHLHGSHNRSQLSDYQIIAKETISQLHFSLTHIEETVSNTNTFMLNPVVVDLLMCLTEH